MKVSVVLPVYNAENTISRAAQSILDQSLRDIELVAIDDGSTDKTLAVLNKINDPRLRIVELPHQGVVHAANAGTQLANASIIARMDADDFSHPDRLRQQVHLLEKEQLDVVGCQVRILNANYELSQSMKRYQRWINEETITTEQIAAYRFVEFPLVNPTIMAKREYFELQFFDNGYPEDYDLLLRAASRGMRFGKVPDSLFDWIDAPGGLTRTHPRYSEEAFMACRRQHFLAGPLRNVETVDLWGLGKTGKSWQRWLLDQGIAIRHAYEVAERRVGKNIHGTVVRHTNSLLTADGTPLLVAVGAATGRASILPQIEAKSYRAGHDAWFVA